MPSFSDLMYASQFRDTVTRVVRQIIRDERPEPRIGKIYSYDPPSQTVMVLFAGETINSLVKARVAKNMIPSQVMITTYETLGYNAPSDIVRVWGSPGSYFVLDFFAGAPVPTSLVGKPEPWLLSTPPAKYILLQGQEEQRGQWPELFTLWGETFGAGDGATTFGVPDGRGKMLIGADGTIAVGSTGGSKTKTLVAANLPPHAHTIAHTHGPNGADQFLANDTGGTENRANGTGFHAKGVGVTTQPSSASSGNGPGTSTEFDVLNPYLGVNWMVRAAS